MDAASTATNLVTQSASAKAQALAAAFLRRNTQNDQAMADLLAAASQGLDQKAPTAPGVGGGLDISV